MESTFCISYIIKTRPTYNFYSFDIFQSIVSYKDTYKLILLKFDFETDQFMQVNLSFYTRSLDCTISFIHAQNMS